MTDYHSEEHNVHKVGLLRAAVLGANDGIISASSLAIGIAASGAGRPEMVTAAVAAVAVGALSFALRVAFLGGLPWL